MTDERGVLVLTASMGAGHTQPAAELVGRLGERMPARMVDLLEILPGRLGSGLREGYAAMLSHAPWLYEGIFQSFFVPRGHWQPSTSPLAALAARQLGRIVAQWRPRAVVSTFHLAGQAAGRLRLAGRLRVPSLVMITEPAAHLLWAHPGTDLFICPYPWVAQEVGLLSGRPTVTPGPLIAPEFARHRGQVAPGRRALGLHAGDHAVLISGGSWGMGDINAALDRLAGLDHIRPVVLCGRNVRLLAQLRHRPGCQALGWRDDLPTLFAAADVLVDNAGGTTCAEAFAAGLPVVGFRPLPGHGRLGMAALIRAGLVRDGQHQLRTVVTALCTPYSAREQQRHRADQVFRADPVHVIADWLGSRRPDALTG
ncbi:hypothetical protein ABZ863_01685 [Saccharomonospora sp. NPDC046836]|uniref:MGDG synthase family glycosyltransferase n=1 Tax=Saccharomonospora sp. NPDC046836 TaxID=3156921 RepID=UPI0033CF41C2